MGVHETMSYALASLGAEILKSPARSWGMTKRASGGRKWLVLSVAALVLTVAGCAVATHESDSGATVKVIQVDGAGGAEEAVPPSRCPAGLRGCRTAEGRIVYVEAHDPDGDGDAHFVIVDSQGITLPGLTAVKVPWRRRPHPLPGLGGLISAAGQVQEGSHGEEEIHAVEFHAGVRR